MARVERGASATALLEPALRDSSGVYAHHEGAGAASTTGGARFRAPMPPTAFDFEVEDRRRSGGGGAPGSHKPYGVTYHLLRWPILYLFALTIAVELAVYTLVRWVISAFEFRKYADVWRLWSATTYDEWKAAAITVDERHGKDKWKREAESPFYDAVLIQSVTGSLRHSLAQVRTGDLRQLMLVACRNNLGGIENEQLYSHTYFGTKRLVSLFVESVVRSIDALSASTAVDNKADLFRKLAKAYGRTALCLSGGASFGYYHLGVVKALLEADVLPTVISGTSAGSLIGAFVCCRTDEELQQALTPAVHRHFKANDEPILKVLMRLVTEGVMFDIGRWELKMKEHITFGNTTFLEAYERTGRILNITVSAEEKFSPPFFLNYKTTPNVVIWSAVLASSSVPSFLPPIELKAKRADGTLEPFKEVGKRWRDGVLRQDIPLTALHQLFGVNYSIVSQVNPHVIPFFFESRGSGGSPTLHWHGAGWRGGFLGSALENALRLDMRKNIQLLQDLNLLPRVLGQDWSFAFLQQFGGTVTIVPPVRLRDYFQIIFDPNERYMADYLLGGQRSTWPKLCMISNRIAIEKALMRAYEAHRLKGAAGLAASASQTLF